MIGVAVLEQEVLLNGSSNHARLQPAQPLEPGVARGDCPHGHRVEKVHIFRRGLLRVVFIIVVVSAWRPD